MPLVDVLMPVGAVSKALLARAVGSVLGQSLLDLRLLAVDDGASEACRRWLQELAEHEPRVTLLQARSPGIVGALASAMPASDAPLIARMDADDVAMPWRLACQEQLLRARPEVDVAATPVYLEGAAQAGWVRHVAWTNRLLTAEEHRAERFVDAPVVHPTVMMRREGLERWGGYRAGPFAEDYELWLRAMASGASFAKTWEPGLVWNRGPGTLTVADPRYAPGAMMQLRATWLAEELRERGGRFVVWGAGESARRLLRALEVQGCRPESVHDIDPRKIGRTMRGRPIQDAEALGRTRPWEAGVVVVGAVASPGARALIGGRLGAAGALLGRDWLPAA